MTDEFVAVNRANWDERVAIHLASDFYNVDAFRNGRVTVKDWEIEEIGPVEGLDLLHLQCHFGLDTLSWARLGARAVGIDFSQNAISQAQALASESNIDARFICASVYDLPPELHGACDIVYTSHGVLCWLPDLRGWAETIASALRPGGRFYISEFHPFMDVFASDVSSNLLRPEISYFGREAHRDEGAGSYADPEAVTVHNVTYQWQHTLSDIVTQLMAVGLQIELFRERPFTLFQRFSFLERRDGAYRTPPDIELPLMFSLRARKGDR